MQILSSFTIISRRFKCPPDFYIDGYKNENTYFIIQIAFSKVVVSLCYLKNSLHGALMLN